MHLVPRILTAASILCCPTPAPPPPSCMLFQYSPKRLLAEVPTMFAFPKLSAIFAAIASAIPATVRTGACKLEGVGWCMGGDAPGGVQGGPAGSLRRC